MAGNSEGSSTSDEELSSEENEPQLVSKRQKTRVTCSEPATLSDVNMLDCPICNASLNSPVYQCIKGHIACAPCCNKKSNRCPSCRLRIGTIRCKAIEKVLESVTVKCRNTLYGCTKTFKNNKKLDHEKTCIYYPCSCPYPYCNYAGLPKSLYTHFGNTHPHSKFSFNTMKSISLDATQTQVFLQDSLQSTLFVLKRKNNYPGSLVSVTCVAHDSQQRGAFLYDLTVVIDKDTHIKIKADVACVSKWTGISEKGLVLPRDLVEHSASLKTCSPAFVSVVCVAPDSSRRVFSYDLTVVTDNDEFINMKAPVECIPKCTDERMIRKSLLPKGLAKNWTNMKLKLIIQRNHEIPG